MNIGQFAFTVSVSVALSCAITLGVVDYRINDHIKTTTEVVKVESPTAKIDKELSEELVRQSMYNDLKVRQREIELDKAFSEGANASIFNAYRVDMEKVNFYIQLGKDFYEVGKSELKSIYFYEYTNPLVICKNGVTN
ncbi:hypothetical protein BN79_023 [Yersinia phage phiR2-01]|uniref:Uncharacterized protein n=1 Tax=Yersinia phage phiR2-01 TaxID=1206557 RepID=I7K2K7_9CAUD|nr:hypothetical protein BN79_023 [Yersinia phage phiR2-01]CCI88451.1 hypothetical protein BN79_023 [Yersinia phage phiR2-01]